MVRFFLLLGIFWIFQIGNVNADILQYDENFPYAFYGDNYQPGYCLTTYETLANDVVYVCKRINIIPVPKVTGTAYSPQIYGRGYCWQSSYGGWWGGYGTQTFGTGVILSQKHEFSLTKLPFDSSKVCVKKAEIDPEACNINIRSIVNGAFSNKFPLDLFQNFTVQTIPNACPSFTIEGQTFQLCYINALTKSLKYVLLIVFIISSVVAL